MNALALLAESPIYVAIGAGLLGLLVGSFLNVVTHRLPIMLHRQWQAQCAELNGDCEPGAEGDRFDLIAPRSRCPKCNHAISALENIPVLSYLLQGGKCRHCRAPISIEYPLVEIATAALSVLVVVLLGPTLQGLVALPFTWALIALTVIDFHEQLLPDIITLPFLWFGVVLSFASVFADLNSSVVGAIAGYMTLWTIYHIFRLVTGKEGMGHGDFKLLGMLGAWLGWQYLPAVIIVSSLVGAVVGIALIAFRGRDRNVPMPFGPFLAAAGWITMLWGEQINQLYLRFAGFA